MSEEEEEEQVCAHDNMELMIDLTFWKRFFYCHECGWKGESRE